MARMRSLLLCTILLAACAGPKAGKATTGDEPVATVTPDAAPPEPVPPPDAAPPEEPPPPAAPAVAPLVKQTDLKALRKTLKTTKDPVERLLVAGQLGEALWAASCKAPQDGLCLAVAARTSKAQRCGPPGDDVTVVARSKTAKEARAAFLQVVKAWDALAPTEPPPAPTTDEEIATYTQQVHMAREVGQAKLAAADAQLEAFFALAAPTGLDFTKDEKKSMKRFDGWFQDAAKLGASARKSYEAIWGDRVLVKLAPEAAIAAMARTGQLQERFASELIEMEVPKDIVASGDESITLFCDTLVDKAAPLEKAAVDAYTSCETTAAALGITGPFPALCSARRDRLGPGQP
jgi:hypothetical protein